jgi:hypothetical protein
MNQDKRPNQRRRVLSDEGTKNLQDGICQIFGEAYRDNPPFQKLSDRTRTSDNSPLEPDTVSRIWKREKAVYRSSLKGLFRAVGLKLEPSDHITFCEDLNTEIPSTDTRVSTQRHQELGKAIESSASTRSSKRGVDYSLWDMIAQMAGRVENSYLPNKSLQALVAQMRGEIENPYNKQIQAIVAVTKRKIENSWLER